MSLCEYKSIQSARSAMHGKEPYQNGTRRECVEVYNPLAQPCLIHRIRSLDGIHIVSVAYSRHSGSPEDTNWLVSHWELRNYFLDLVVEAATRKAQNSGIVTVDCLLDSETSLQRLTIVGGNEQNEIKMRIRRQHNGKYMGRREKAVKTSAWITAGFRRMRKQQSSLEGNSSIEEKRFSVPWNRIHKRVLLSTFSKKDDRLAYRPEITGINGKIDSTTTLNRNAFDI
ncbi:hypothetical protein ALC53_08756 [Atta colombica]|uniref:Uncharacterized protein n=1 Tax=Atta colombica TaxID=520822 RepID=A0A195B950_9HYME|nr:hypothetical protein ALC53_08756 [Atta colombica]